MKTDQHNNSTSADQTQGLPRIDQYDRRAGRFLSTESPEEWGLSALSEPVYHIEETCQILAGIREFSLWRDGVSIGRTTSSLRAYYWGWRYRPSFAVSVSS